MTTKVVADEVLGRFARQQADWFRRVREGSLDPEEVAQVVQSLIDKPLFRFDKRKNGWELLEDTREPWPISADKLDLVPFLGDCKSYIGGEDVVSRARGDLKANLGQCHSEYLLKHQNEIPEEFRKHILVFTGTIWRRRFGHRSVPYLIWNGERWYLYFRGLEDGFCSDGRLLRSRE